MFYFIIIFNCLNSLFESKMNIMVFKVFIYYISKVMIIVIIYISISNINKCYFFFNMLESFC